ncbi:MAG TPA: hypothetical protein VLD18_10480, partial [Verrucomicrobiae bacterium]|nr:hypothetical protein [Verrucomicrobiae bacterium]
ETALQRDCSEQTAREIDQEVKKILDRAYSEARELLAQHREQLEAVAAELLKVETLDGQRFHELIGLPPPESIAKPPAAVSKRRRAAAKKPETPARSGT